jgi:diacylglycerol O-acyltransferase/trehalose O-mycolyltransferase
MRRGVPAAVLAGVFTAFTASTVPVTSADAADSVDPPEACRPFGDTAVYSCAVHSSAMDRDIDVVVRPSLTAGNPEVAQFIDGANSTAVNTWVTGADALDHLSDEDATLVFPAMDAFTWSLDWDDLNQVKFETFMAEELPDFLEDGFDVPHGGRGTTGVAGLSSGAYGAMNLASRHNDLYSSVYAMSGLYDPQAPLQRVVIDSTSESRSDYGRGPWTSESGRAENNPTLNIRKLTMPVLVTAADGVPNLGGDLGPDAIATIFSGSVYEAGSMLFTSEFQTRAVLAGRNNIEFRYDTVGAHTWDTWQRSAFDQGNVYTFLDRIGGGGTPPTGPVGSAVEGSGSSGSSGSSTVGS